MRLFPALKSLLMVCGRRSSVASTVGIVGVASVMSSRESEREREQTRWRVVVVIAWFSCGSMPDIPSVGEQYSNAASYARSKGLQVEGDQETFGKRLTEVCSF